MKKKTENRPDVDGQSTQLRLVQFVREGLHDFVVTAGMSALERMLEADREELCGERYGRDVAREHGRAGHVPGSLVLGGRKVAVARPRVRSKSGHEVQLPSWTRFSAHDPLEERAREQMLIGVSTRRYERSLEDLPEGMRSKSTSKSTVSRNFIKATEAQLDEWLRRDLSGIAMCALMLDGIHFDDHVMLAAVAIDEKGHKHVLGVRLGATENATVCRELLGDLRERGMRTDKMTLVVLDGSKALRRAVIDVFGQHALIQRCQLHKMRNVIEHVPESMRDDVRAAMREAYGTRNAERAKKLLTNLARKLRETEPSAAASLDEGLDETLTVMRMQLPRHLERILSNTNVIENLMSKARDTTRRVKRWRDGAMVHRWMVAAVLDAEKRFRRIMGYQHLPQLLAALDSPPTQLAHAQGAA